MQTYTDCRTDEGLVVGLIDSIIFCARAIKRSGISLSSEPIKEALKDLQQDTDLAGLLTFSENKG